MILLFVLLMVVSLTTHAVWWQTRDHPRSWADADWSSAGILAAAGTTPEASVYVFAGRTGRWKGIFAHHTWIVVKPAGASRYTRYDVVGWGRPVRTDAYAPDGRWYGGTPRILLDVRGAAAERLIPKIQVAVSAYPHSELGSYKVWPGPNSNTFVASIARRVPELAAALLPTAIGKDYAGGLVFVGATPSGTGAQVSAAGLLGVSVGWVEGIEINVLGLVTGIDVRCPALKLPGWGRVGVSVQR